MRIRFHTALLCAALIASITIISVGADKASEAEKAASEKAAGETSEKAGLSPKIQLAILLDTSNSMDGLIAQAKTQLWKIVNELVTAELDGKRPELEVALYEYGKSSIPRSEGHLRMILPLTTDLDKVSEELFALRTNGGQEYCGQVIQAATDGLKWSEDRKDLKLIYIAGNEPFTQGKVDYKKACADAIQKNITINTIFCGNVQTGISTKWKDGALLADGTFMSIDQNKAVVHITSPQDKEIVKLNTKLNTTYIAFGASGAKGKARQKKQDANSISSGSAVQRIVTKSNHFYSNWAWDLCDAITEKKVKLEDIKEKDLPANMRKMTLEERKAYVASNLERRKEIHEKIKKLNEARKTYVAAEMKKLAKDGKNTLDQALSESIRVQAAKKNFKFQN